MPEREEIDGMDTTAIYDKDSVYSSTFKVEIWSVHGDIRANSQATLDSYISKGKTIQV